MKTKIYLANIFALALTIILPSCKAIQGPDNWAVEIEDSYKMQMVLAFDYALYDKDAVDELAELIDETAEKKADYSMGNSDIAMYKLALEELAPNNAGASELLQGYEKLEVKFSEWIEQPNKDGYSVWLATEEMFDIRVTFKINKALDWDVELDDEDFTHFMTEWAERVTEELEKANKINEQNEEVFMFFYKEMKDEFSSQDQQYLKEKYPSGIPSEKLRRIGEYEGDETYIEIIPKDDVLIDFISHHYKTPDCVGEVFAIANREDYYERIDITLLCYAYKRIKDIMESGNMYLLLSQIENVDSPIANINKLKYAKSDSDKKICMVLNYFIYLRSGNDFPYDTDCLFDHYFDFSKCEYDYEF